MRSKKVSREVFFDHVAQFQFYAVEPRRNTLEFRAKRASVVGRLIIRGESPAYYIVKNVVPLSLADPT